MDALIIDDDEFTSELLEVFLKRNGCKVSKCFTLDQGLKALEAGLPDVVFLDIVLPDGDGIDFLGKLREKYKDLPVVMVTGFKDAEKVVKAFREGATDCLLKPINFDYLNSVLIKLSQKKIGQGGS